MKKNRLISTDPNRVKLFMKVVEYQGFSTAASVLDVSPANISIQMRKLEDLLGVKLCHRGNKGFRLTSEGKRIYEAGQALMLAHENFDSMATALERELVGELQLGVIDNAVFDPDLNVSELLHKLKKHSPKVEVTLHTLSPNELERGVLDQRLHLAIGVFHERNSDLDYHSICHEKLTLYCGRSHPLFNAGKIRLNELESYAYIERTYAQTLNNLNIDFAPRIQAYTSSLEAALIMILSGDYLGFLPQYYAQQWVSQGFAKSLLPEILHVKTEVAALANRNPVNTLMTNTVLDLILSD